MLGTSRKGFKLGGVMSLLFLILFSVVGLFLFDYWHDQKAVERAIALCGENNIQSISTKGLFSDEIESQS